MCLASFTQHNVFEIYPCCFCISNLLLFLLLTTIPLCEYTTPCLSIILVMDIWIISSLCLLWIKWIWTFLCKAFFRHIFLVFSYKYLGVVLLIHRMGRCMFNVFTNCHTIFHNGSTTLHSHQQYTRGCPTSSPILIAFHFTISSGYGAVSHFFSTFYFQIILDLQKFWNVCKFGFEGSYKLFI